MVIKEVLNEARNLLTQKDIEPREARLLLAYSMGISSDDLIKFNECTDEQYSLFKSFIDRRCEGEPFAYIVGYKEFMKLKFNVNKNVLIPREDTEILVEEAIKTGKKKILDMCTGSGCIAISLAKYILDSEVEAVDISKDALEVAISNNELNQTNVKFINSNLFENVESRYELIVSNPPYIPKADIEGLQIEVKNEPILALDGGNDGLDFYRIIIETAKAYLMEKGILMFEIGYSQAEDVSKLFYDNGYENINVVKDFGGNDRVVFAERGE